MKLFVSIFTIFFGMSVSANELLTLNRSLSTRVSHTCSYSVMKDENTLDHEITGPFTIDNYGGYSGFLLVWTSGEMPMNFYCYYEDDTPEIACSIYDNDSDEVYASGKMPVEANVLSVYKQMSATLRVRAMCVRVE